MTGGSVAFLLVDDPLAAPLAVLVCGFRTEVLGRFQGDPEVISAGAGDSRSSAAIFRPARFPPPGRHGGDDNTAEREHRCDYPTANPAVSESVCGSRSLHRRLPESAKKRA